jgi:hypothetical protein
VSTVRQRQRQRQRQACMLQREQFSRQELERLAHGLSVYRSAISNRSKNWLEQHRKPDRIRGCEETNVFETDVLQTAASSRRWGGNRWRPRWLNQSATSISRCPKIPAVEGNASCSTKAGLPIPWPLACTVVEKGSTTFRTPYLLLLVAVCIDCRCYAALYCVHGSDTKH